MQRDTGELILRHRDFLRSHKVARGVMKKMLSAALYLLTGSLLFSLRLAGNTGSFPKPLSAAEEQEYLEKFAAGDIEARNVLIERNLRLVAHIVKKVYCKRLIRLD